MLDISVIVRFRDEADYLGATLQAVRSQQLAENGFEIVAVDNGSEDGSGEIAERFADRVLQIDAYRPGKALNCAIAEARGRHICVLSAHTIPADRHWLRRLRSHMETPRLAGVYGAQLYNAHSRFLDKRDLDIFSTLEPRIETVDSDFWNANSMFPRAVWERQRFDETVFELEDHHWTKQLLPLGLEVHFEPRALVYHYSHIYRLDREFLPPSELTPRQRIDQAVAELEAPDADWPRVMVAGLTLSSLTSAPYIDRAVPALGRMLLEHGDFDVRWRMAQALGKIPLPESVAFLVPALRDRSFYPRDETAWSLARLGALSVPEVARSAPGLDPEHRPFAALALGASGGPQAGPWAVAILLEELGAGDHRRSRDAAYFAGEIATARSADSLVEPLATLLESGDRELCKVSCWALGCFAGCPGVRIEWQKLRELAADHADELVRYEATVALGKRAGVASADPGSSLLDPLLSASRDEVARVRYGAVQSLRLLAERGFDVPAPKGLPNDPDFGVRFEGSLLARAVLAAPGYRWAVPRGGGR